MSKSKVSLSMVLHITRLSLTLEAETIRREEKIKAESEADISKIEMEKQVHAKEALKKMEEIENEIYRNRE